MPRMGSYVQYVSGVDAFFVASCGVAGVVVGAALDPVGQMAAERSRAIEERNLAERAAGPSGSGSGSGSAESVEVVPDLVPPDAIPESGPAAGLPADADADPDPQVHLLPGGRSTGRTVGAALVTGVLWAATAHEFGTHLLAAPFLVFAAVAVAVSVTDLTHRLVPRHLLYGALALIVPFLVATSAVDHTWDHLVRAAVWGAVAFAVFFGIWFFVPRGMGFGDVRLAGLIGLTVGYLGPIHVYLGFLVGFVLGLLLGVVLMVRSPSGHRTRIPFAPALCAGAMVAVLWGTTLGLHLFHAGS